MNSIVSYKERGEGGKNSFRGNCSPKLINDLATFLKVKEIADYACGSGTTADVAAQLGIESHCYDLHSGFNLLHDEIKERPEFIFSHPAYWDIIKYAGEQYSAEKVIQQYGYDPRSSDLSRTQPWENFLEELNYCTMKQFAALEKGGHMAILVGDVKKKGKLFSIILEMIKPGKIKQIIIKAQHNCWSDSVSYSGKAFIPIVHEYVLLLQKENALLFNVQVSKNGEVDIRDIEIPTWKNIVVSVLEEMGGKASLDKIYEAIDGHKRTEVNREWRAKIRQTLQIHPKDFYNIDCGVWALAA
ncbi:MAG: hypothetical protein LBI03_07690 [Clostridiales bacterium]|jgi:hypothetical protein|nr:hypothetical protein [Clostridiales bacterium]